MKVKRKVSVYETSHFGATAEVFVDNGGATNVKIDGYCSVGDLEELAELFTKLAAKARKRAGAEA
jgi:hypothetical protein